MTTSVFLICKYSKTWMVLQLQYRLATKVHTTYPHAHPPENIAHRDKHCGLLVNISRLLKLDCIPRWLINLNNCASISSAISSIYLVTVLAERGTCATSWTAASPKSSWKLSSAPGRIDSSVRVKDFLTLAMMFTTKNDAQCRHIWWSCGHH